MRSLTSAGCNTSTFFDLLPRQNRIVSQRVNIEVDRYPGRMKRATDPDVLLLQAAADRRAVRYPQLSAEAQVCAQLQPIAAGSASRPFRTTCASCELPLGRVRTPRNVDLLLTRPEAVARFRVLAGELEPRSVGSSAALASGTAPLDVVPRTARTWVDRPLDLQVT